MMKTIKTIDCVLVNNLLKGASLGKMESADKFAVIKTIKALKPICEDFESFRMDAAERLKGENHDEMQKLAWEWRDKGDKCGLTDEEKVKVNTYFEAYAHDLKECIDEEINKENEVDIRTISEDALGKLLDANDGWNVEQIIKLQEMLCE